MDFQDLLYEVRNGVAWITINRPDKMNAFRGTTCDELIKALHKAGYDRTIGCIVLAGAGDRAFCTRAITGLGTSRMAWCSSSIGRPMVPRPS
jgi:2-ketocyclohexanecarboxyl-CoA hydrolase